MITPTVAGGGSKVSLQQITHNEGRVGSQAEMRKGTRQRFYVNQIAPVVLFAWGRTDLTPRVYREQDPGQRCLALDRGNASSPDELDVSEETVSKVKDMWGQREDEEIDPRGETQLKVDTLVTNLVSKGLSLTPGRTGGTGTERAETRSCLLC